MKTGIGFCVVVLFLVQGCSRIIGPNAFNQSADFSITAQALAGKQVKITIPGSIRPTGQGPAEIYDYSYTYVKDAEGKETSVVDKAYIEGDSLFWGYYIYRNETNPFEPFFLRGFTGRSEVDGSTPPRTALGFWSQNAGSAPFFYFNNSQDQSYTDTCDIAGKTYYYRVGKVTRDWECGSNCLCSDTTCSSPCSCAGSWNGDGYVDSISAWVSVTCQL